MTSHAPGVVTLKPLTVIIPAVYAPLRAGTFGDGGALAGAAIARVANLYLNTIQTFVSDTNQGYEKVSFRSSPRYHEPIEQLCSKMPCFPRYESNQLGLHL